MARGRRPVGRVVAIEGPSGVGKSELARTLAPLLGARWLPEAFERLRPRPSLRVAGIAALLALERRLLAEETRRFRSADRLRRRGGTIVLDTGLLGPYTYARGLAHLDPARDVTGPIAVEVVRRWRTGALGLPDVTIYLDAPAATVVRRAREDPTGHPADLWHRHFAVARLERRFWRALARRLPPGRVRFLSARAPTVRLALQIARDLARNPPPPVGPEETRVVLEALLPASRVTVKSGGRSARAPR